MSLIYTTTTPGFRPSIGTLVAPATVRPRLQPWNPSENNNL